MNYYVIVDNTNEKRFFSGYQLNSNRIGVNIIAQFNTDKLHLFMHEEDVWEIFGDLKEKFPNIEIKKLILS